MKSILLLRHISGAGSSTFANYLKDLYPSCVICSADDYFIVDGEYKFDASKLGKAHSGCQEKFSKAVDNGEKLIIVANTLTTQKEFSLYEDYGKTNGYTVFFIVLENRHNGKDIHGLNEETLQRQENRLRGSLKLR